MRACFVVFALTWFACPSRSAGDWPQFRGPRGDGHSTATGLPMIWGGLLEPPAWQTDIPGTGWSSPIVIGDRIWLTTAELTALPEEVQAKKLVENPFGEEGAFQVHAQVSLMAIELDAADGTILRRLELFKRAEPTPIHLANTYASPTPVSDGQRLYCHFGSLGTAAVSLETGRVLWRRRFPIQDITGPGSSPVLSGDRLILTCDGADQQFLVALDIETGNEVWRTERPPMVAEDARMRRAFSTPLVVHDGRRLQLIAPAAQWVASYDPVSGEELWRLRHGEGHAVVPRPVYRRGLVYICTGYWQPELWAVRVDGSGDVSDTHVAWKHQKQAPLISSPIVIDKEVYFVSPKGIAKCLDAETGELVWEHRLGGSFCASPLAADGKLFFTSERGVTTVLQPGREYRELARNELFGQTLASLAVGNESLLIRTASGLCCVRKNP